MIRLLGGIMGQIVKFCALTGLRPSETIECARLLNNEVMAGHKLVNVKYYNPERQCLEHFRFPDIFLRQTKKAYISFVTADMLTSIHAHNGDMPSYNSIRLACRKRCGIMMDMRYCRKIFASYLHDKGISDVTIDMLQERTSKSVLAQHYITPDNTMRERVLDAVSSLRKELERNR